MKTSNVIILNRREKEDLHSVLRRALERAEQRRDDATAAQLAQEVAALAEELARMP